jgi:serine/threonine protein kinase
MRLVKIIKDAKYIHGDIRETNVLCNVETSIMTIIDFGMMKKRADFLQDYLNRVNYFYSHPPELTLMQLSTQGTIVGAEDPKSIYNDIEEEKDAFTDFLERTDIEIPLTGDDYAFTLEGIVDDIRSNRPIFDEKVDRELAELYVQAKQRSLISAVKRARINFPANPFNVMEKTYLDTTDMYGLGIALYKVIERVLDLRIGKDPTAAPTKTFLYNTLFKRMMAADYQARWSVEKVIEEMTDFLKTTFPKQQAVLLKNIDQQLATAVAAANAKDIAALLPRAGEGVVAPLVSVAPAAAAPAPVPAPAPAPAPMPLEECPRTVLTYTGPIKTMCGCKTAPRTGGRRRSTQKHRKGVQKRHRQRRRTQKYKSRA